MKVSSQQRVSVYYHGLGTKQLVGTLLLAQRQIHFEYAPSFLNTGLALSPFKLPLKPGVISNTEAVFDGLFGIFNDSLPDGWGRMLLDRKLLQLGIHPRTLTPLDRLCYVGSRGMGALSYEPEHPEALRLPPADLDHIYQEIQHTLSDDDRYLDELIHLGGSSAGARPKILLSQAQDDWVIKFPSSLDPRDIGPIEYAYHLMAKEAGLLVPEANLFPTKKGSGFFGVKRFDRENGQKIHMHTAAGLLHADHRELSMDYEILMKATRYLTQDIRECNSLFRLAVFNVLSYNRDDHAKNFSFVMDSAGTWRLSPAYDLTFSSGPAGEHSTLIMGEGKQPRKIHLLQLARFSEINPTEAERIIEQVHAAIGKWHYFADHAGVSSKQTSLINNVLNKITDDFHKDK